MDKKTKIIGIVYILSVLLVAALGSVFVYLGMPWFNSLTTPTMWIPNFVIPIVWTIIYLSFGVILFVWNKQERINKPVNILLAINGALNILWCLVFFTLKQTFLGEVVIVINAYFAVYLIYSIAKQKKLYSIILTLYPLWICVATTLNTALWILS